MNNIVKKIAISILIGACFILLFAVNLERQTDIIYTHVFYVPIFLAVFWFGKHGVYLALILSLLHLLVNYYLFAVFLPSAIFRSVFFILFALIAHFFISRITKKELDSKELEPISQRDLIGNMAVTIGSEVRNSMASTKAFLQLFHDDTTNTSQKEYFDIVIDEIDKTSETLNDYILLDSNVRLNLEPVNLSTLVNELEPIISELTQPSGIVLEKKLANIPDLLLDKKQVGKLIIHLVRNAVDAMPSGGKLTINTGVDTDTNRVVISVHDEGPGVAPDISKKIGTPFITSKESHTGLGLAICYSILSRHNASMEFSSGESGATFYCFFPIT